jgi:hypothetical protein
MLLKIQGSSARIWTLLSCIFDVRLTYDAILPEIGAKTTKKIYDVKKWEYRDFLGNLGIFWELTWDFYKITVGNAVSKLCSILAGAKQRHTLYKYWPYFKFCEKGRSFGGMSICSIFFLLSSIHSANYVYIYFHTLLMRNVCVYSLNIVCHIY